MLARMLQINAVARAIQCDLSLLSAALRADTPMHRWAEPLFLSLFANCAGQLGLQVHYVMSCHFHPEGRPPPEQWPSPCLEIGALIWPVERPKSAKPACFMAVFGS